MKPKNEKPKEEAFGLDMDFEEALECFLNVGIEDTVSDKDNNKAPKKPQKANSRKQS